MRTRWFETVSLSLSSFFLSFLLGPSPHLHNSVGSLIKSSPFPPNPSISLMARFSDDADLWLPAEFLPDEDLFLEEYSPKDSFFSPFSSKFRNELRTEFDSFGSGSVINSPVESTASSFETEASDEEFLAALTLRLAQSALYETKKQAAPYLIQNEHVKKNWFVSGSPPSTLTGIGRLPSTGKFSGHGSPNGPLQFPSPPETPFETEKDTWDLIYAAAGQVARLQTGLDLSKYSINPFPHSRTHLCARCPSPLPCLKGMSSVSYLGEHLYHNPAHSAQIHGRLYDQVLKDECSMECRKMPACSVLQHRRQQFAGCENGRYEPLPALVHNPWQIDSQGRQPQLKSSSFQAAFNGGTCAKKESVGTGVFLPRNYSNPPEPRKQTGLSTVRPVMFQGNGLSYTDTKERSGGRPFNSGSGRDYTPKHELSGQQRQAAYVADAAQKKELLLLPQEWTY